MRLSIPGLLLMGTLTWVSAAPAPGWQDPPRGQRPPRPGGAERGEPGPGPGRPPGGDEEGPGDPPPPPPPSPLFEALDTNDDGELSPKEIAAASKSLAKLDRNQDGVLTEDEVHPPPPPPPGRGGPGGPAGRGQNPKALVDSVMKFDKDGDGKVSADELPERMSRMMEQGDTNKDGSLVRSEIEAVARKQAATRRPGPPGGGPPGGGDGPPPPPPGRGRRPPPPGGPDNL